MLDQPEPLPLPPAALEAFRKNGHIVLRNFISKDELARYASDVREAVVDHRHDWDRENAGAPHTTTFQDNC